MTDPTAVAERADWLARWHTLGAFHGCDAHAREHGINYTAVLETTGPAAVAALLDVGHREGYWCSLDDDDDHRHCYAVLDVRAEDGDIVTDQCIPTREAFDWWAQLIELRVDMSDCPVDTPEAHARTYAFAQATNPIAAAAILLDGVQ